MNKFYKAIIVILLGLIFITLNMIYNYLKEIEFTNEYITEEYITEEYITNEYITNEYNEYITNEYITIKNIKDKGAKK